MNKNISEKATDLKGAAASMEQASNLWLIISILGAIGLLFTGFGSGPDWWLILLSLLAAAQGWFSFTVVSAFAAKLYLDAEITDSGTVQGR